MDGMTRIIIEGSDNRLTELLEVALKQGFNRPESAPEPGDPGVLDGDLLAAWLTEQFEDPALEATMLRGSLESSPFQAVAAELIRRAGG